MKLDKKNRKKFIAGIILISVFIIISILITYKFYPQIKELQKNPQKLEEIKILFESYGLWGIFILIIIQVLQVIISIIPGGPFQIVAGIIYGTFTGFLISFIGMSIGALIVYFMVKLFKNKFISLFIDKNKLEEYSFLNDSPKLDLILSILFFIPGAPKDTLIYYAAFIGMDIKKYITITILMRFPAMLFSTLIGNNIGIGNLKFTIFLIIVLALAGILGLWYHNKYIKKNI